MSGRLPLVLAIALLAVGLLAFSIYRSTATPEPPTIPPGENARYEDEPELLPEDRNP